MLLSTIKECCDECCAMTSPNSPSSPLKKFNFQLSCNQFLTYLIILVLMYHFTESVDDFRALQTILTIQLKLGMLSKAN